MSPQKLSTDAKITWCPGCGNFAILNSIKPVLLELDEEGIARRGLIIRHLILPNGIAGTKRVFRFIAEELSHRVSISLMSQYFPSYNAGKFPELDRRITAEEYTEAVLLLEEYGLQEGWRQEIVR